MRYLAAKRKRSKRRTSIRELVEVVLSSPPAEDTPEKAALRARVQAGQ